MSSLIIVDMNKFIQDDSTLTTLAGGEIIILPFNTKEPCDPSGSPFGLPFLRYFWMPNVFSINRYFIRRDRMRYYVMDRDFERMMNITDRLIYLFNQEHAGEMIVPCDDSSLRVFNVWVSNSTSIAPNERDGLAQQMVEVEVRYVPTSGNSNYQ